MYEVQYKWAVLTAWSASPSTSATVMNLSGLTNGISYDVRVRACNSAGCGDWSQSESATPATNPGALPTTPTGLVANGNIVNGQVSLWWQASTGAMDYNLRYAVESCTNTPQKTASSCTPGDWGEVNAITNTTATLTAGTGAVDQLEPKTVYRLQIRGANAYGQSDWSDVAFVYPTSSAPTADGFPPPSDPPEIATTPLYGYQAKNVQRVHEFRYIICGNIPAGVSMSTTQIAVAIEKWEEAVKKDSSGNSMVQTTRTYHPSPPPAPAPAGTCQPPSGLYPTGDNEVMFADDRAMSIAVCRGGTPACWRSSTWDRVQRDSLMALVGSLPSIAKGTILLRETKSIGGNASDWNGLAYSNAPCKFVEHMIVHEVGHALGIGWPLNNHPRNSTLSVMSAGEYGGDKSYCEPQAYDILAIMANYQSR